MCYGKPLLLLLLEAAKYRHPRLTLAAEDVEEGTASLRSVASNTCGVPDADTLRRFILHVLDHYLVPVSYKYFFEPGNLDILSHFDHNRSVEGLEQLMRQV